MVELCSKFLISSKGYTVHNPWQQTHDNKVILSTDNIPD